VVDTAVLCTRLPEVPVTVTVQVPMLAPVVSTVSVEDGSFDDTDVGLRVAVSPEPVGTFVLSVTVAEKPLLGSMVIVYVAWLPCCTVLAAGVADSEKSPFDAVAGPVRGGAEKRSPSTDGTLVWVVSTRETVATATTPVEAEAQPTRRLVSQRAR
jgi:hypothetical protein